MNFISTLFLISSLPFLFSCGKDKKSGNAPSTSPELYEQESEGSYRAILRPLNNHLSGFLPTGSAEIEIAGDSVMVSTLLDDDAKVVHLQSIHRGTRCPNQSDDENADGVIDLSEAIKASGDVLIPLDRDLNSATLGENLYPSGSGFTYTEQASLTNLQKDVSERTGENLNLSGRAVLIHGVASFTTLPQTVRTLRGLSQQNSVPVVCGILKRL
jgi:hypothetical protein